MANPPRGTYTGTTKSSSGNPMISNTFEITSGQSFVIDQNTTISATQIYVITYGQIPNWNQIPIDRYGHGTIDEVTPSRLSHLTLDIEL